MAPLEPAIMAMAHGLPGATAGRGADGRAGEFMHDVAYLLPVIVIRELIGGPEGPEGFRPVAGWAGIVELNDAGTLPAVNAAGLLAYLTALAVLCAVRPAQLCR